MARALLQLGHLTEHLAESAWFAYTTIVLLQLKITWGMWHYRDLTSGDTSSYFVTAYDWFTNGRTVIAWSPLYTTLYGSMLALSSDAYVATTAHRMLIVLLLAVLVLALMRRLLPEPVAWAVAAWWVVSPIVFESRYEVHLFAVIPLLVVYLISLSKPGPRTRGAALGILLGSALLMRNEHIVVVALFGAIVLVYEVWRVKKRGAAAYPPSEYWRGYGLPVVVVCVLTLFFYSRAHDKIPVLFDVLRDKHTLNICQIYAFGYQQRHPEWLQSPWTECAPLMVSTFGKPQPSLVEAVMRNPGAMWEHFVWNLSLIPNGLQVLLFNATSGTVNPDYTPVPTGWKYTLVCSVLLAALYLIGLYKLCRAWDYWWAHWLQLRVWGWVVMACPLVMVLCIMITQRPRPAYLFSLSLLMMAAAGFCGYVIAHQWSVYRYLSQCFAVPVVVLVLLCPSYYSLRASYYNAAQADRRFLLRDYRTLEPFQTLMRRPGTVLLTVDYAVELCNYLGIGDQNCQAVSYETLQSQVTNDTDWLSVLDKHGINLFYVDERVFDDPRRPTFISDPGAYGWETIGSQNAAGRRWMLLHKPRH